MLRYLFIVVIFASLITSTPANAQLNDAPIGSIVAWHKSLPNMPPLPSEWVECNGQVLIDGNSPLNGQSMPDLNGSIGIQRFLRGGLSSGNAGGTENHLHFVPPPPGTCFADCSGGGPGWGATSSGATSNTSSTLPTYFEVVWVMKVRPQFAEGAPAVSTWGLGILGLLILVAATLVMARRREVVV